MNKYNFGLPGNAANIVSWLKFIKNIKFLHILYTKLNIIIKQISISVDVQHFKTGDPDFILYI